MPSRPSWSGPDGARRPLYLHTSPEFACKKLLAAGEERIFTFAPVFRNRERGALHHPEFTMLEWYRAGEPYERLMEDCARDAADRRRRGRHRRCCASASAPPIRSRAPERLTVAEAFQRFAGIDLLATLGDGAPRSRARSRAAAERGRHPRRPTTTRGPTSSAACWSRGSSRTSATAAPRS